MTPLRLRSPDELDPIRSRYVKLLIHAATSGEPEPSAMNTALALCDALARQKLRGLQLPPFPDRLADAGGHHRPFYTGLMIYCRRLASRIAGEADEGEQRRLRTLIRHPTEATPLPWPVQQPEDGSSHSIAAERAPDAATWLWSSLSVRMDELSPQTANQRPPLAFCRVLESQTAVATGSFFESSSLTNPEPWWYHELVALHAFASYAMLTGSKEMITAARKAALFHHRETQPDHATSQPWAIHAFLMDPETIPTADLLLLAAGVNQPGGLGAIPRLLLADAAVALSIA